MTTNPKKSSKNHKKHGKVGNKNKGYKELNFASLDNAQLNR